MQYSILTTLLNMSFCCFAYSATAAPPDTLDHFPDHRIKGGAQAFYQEVGSSFSYPRLARQSSTIGTSVISFVLNPSGSISDWQIVNSLGKGIDQEVLNVFKKTKKKWLPDSTTNKSFILFFPVHFVIDGLEFTQTNHDAGFMQKEVTLVAYGGRVGRFIPDQTLIDQATTLYQKKSFKQASYPLDELIRRNPYDEGLYKMRAYCRYQTDDLPGACEDYLKIKTFLRQPISPAAEKLCK